MTQIKEDIGYIKEMMERASKFKHINGLSVFAAGIIATAGAVFLYFFMDRQARTGGIHRNEVMTTFWTLLAVLALAITVIFFASWLTAKRKGEKLLTQPTRQALYNFLIPLAVGAIISLIFLMYGRVRFVFLFSLIFYGLALFSVSKYTLHELHFLGLAEIALGLAGMLSFGRTIFLWAEQASHIINATLSVIIWWAVGFGLLHIVFGLWIYIKYNRKKQA